MVQHFDAPAALNFTAQNDAEQAALARFRGESLLVPAVFKDPNSRNAQVGMESQPRRTSNDRAQTTDQPVQPPVKGDQLDDKRLDVLGQLFANSLLDTGRLEMKSPAGEELFVELFQQYGKQKEAGMQKLLDAINKHLNGDFTLSMHDNPELTKMVTAEAQRQGKAPPDFVRLIEMTDSKGRHRGDLLFMHGASGPDRQKI
jgi:hypothetical protein